MVILFCEVNSLTDGIYPEQALSHLQGSWQRPGKDNKDEINKICGSQSIQVGFGKKSAYKKVPNVKMNNSRPDLQKSFC